jgi:proline dehydrogenase
VVIGMKPTIYSVFCGGTSLEKTRDIIQSMHRFGVGAILDYGVEGKEEEADFERTANEVIKAIDFAAGNEAVRFVSSKFTGLLRFAILEKLHAGQSLTTNELQEYARCVARINEICAHAAANGISLLVDAEESWIQAPLDELVTGLMRKHNRKQPIIYNTIQLYLSDRLPYFRQAIAQAEKEGYIYAAKLVRGAYMEKEAERANTLGSASPIQPNKEATDRDFDDAVVIALDHIDHVAVCIATHNEDSCLKACELMSRKRISPQHAHVYFSQLLGMSDHISFNLAKAGYAVGKYLPYGPVADVIPYLIRRAQENTSVGGQMSRELALLKLEVRRRRLQVL